MTSGTTLDDWDGYIGGSPLGNYFSRVWNGGDRSGVDLDYNAEHAYTCTVKQRTHGAISYKILASTFNKTSHFVCPALPKISTFPTNRCTSKVWDQMVQSKFNAGVFAGEFKETVEFISSSIKALAGSIKSVRRGRFKRAVRALVDRPPPPKALLLPKKTDNVGLLANNWLSYHYALIPLLNDIVAAYEYLKHNYEIVKRVKVSAIDEYAYTITQTNCTWNYEGKSIYQIRCEIYSKISSADRLGLTDPLSVAWELTRLSFVVDWLIPVGSFLKAVNASRACEVRKLFVTKCSHEKLFSPVCKSVVGFTWLIPAPSGDTNRHVFVHRLVLTTLPVAIPAIENPLGLSYQKYVTASALLSQAFGKKL